MASTTPSQSRTDADDPTFVEGMTPKTRTLLLALGMPGQFDPEAVDPDDVADEIVDHVNRGRHLDHKKLFDRVTVSAIPGPQWLTVRTVEALRRPNELADALLRACMYLDGFLWIEDPEASELEAIKDTVAAALGCENWDQAMDLARLREARRGED